MKKIASIFLIFIIILNLSGYFVVFSIMQHNIKEEVEMCIKKGIPESELCSFRFPKDQKLQESFGLRWLESNEFYYRGMLYDVVSKEECGNEIVIKCINDTQEKKCYAFLNSEVNRLLHSNPAKSKTLNILSKLNFQYIKQNNTDVIFAGYQYKITSIFLLPFFNNLSLEVYTPPPVIA